MLSLVVSITYRGRMYTMSPEGFVLNRYFFCYYYVVYQEESRLGTSFFCFLFSVRVSVRGVVQCGAKSCIP